ncbi:MAG: hypothetical protein COA74_11280 [Gammaproteobacteria bacterium]|nr:MAG: hypothetical protein COA74_11280 [Gammaproteobacteria bacterium]
MITALNSLNSLLESGKLLKAGSTTTNLSSFDVGIRKSGQINAQLRSTDNFEVFNAVLQKAYKQLAFNPDKSATFSETSSPVTKSEVAGYKSVDKISSEQASSTILNFINGRLKLDEIQGADTNALLERLEQGLDGFIRGFSEAKQIIEDLGLLTPTLLNEINDTYTRVTEGIEQLRDGILGDGSDSIA